MAALTLEQKKQRYSRDLAEHTLRQWNTLRQNQARETTPAKGRILTQSGTAERHPPSSSSSSSPPRRSAVAGKTEVEHIDRHGSRSGSRTPRRESKHSNGTRLWDSVAKAWRA